MRKKGVFLSGDFKNRAFSQSKSGCCNYGNHSVIVFSLMISQSKICFCSIDQSNLLFCFSLPFTFLLAELFFFSESFIQTFLKENVKASCNIKNST